MSVSDNLSKLFLQVFLQVATSMVELSVLSPLLSVVPLTKVISLEIKLQLQFQVFPLVSSKVLQDSNSTLILAPSYFASVFSIFFLVCSES
jgi:hypothetical protein